MYLCGSSSSSSSSTFLRNLWVGDFGLLYAKEDGLRPFEQPPLVTCIAFSCNEAHRWYPNHLGGSCVKFEGQRTSRGFWAPSGCFFHGRGENHRAVSHGVRRCTGAIRQLCDLAVRDPLVVK